MQKEGKEKFYSIRREKVEGVAEESTHHDVLPAPTLAAENVHVDPGPLYTMPVGLATVVTSGLQLAPRVQGRHKRVRVQFR